jgi:hypothetical protein
MFLNIHIQLWDLKKRIIQNPANLSADQEQDKNNTIYRFGCRFESPFDCIKMGFFPVFKKRNFTVRKKLNGLMEWMENCIAHKFIIHSKEDYYLYPSSLFFVYIGQSDLLM